MLAGALLLLPNGAIAGQACVDPGSGIGGTGAPQGGIGGTGAPAVGGTGGTGDRAGSGIGGTGALAGAIGGTGDRAAGSGIGGTGAIAGGIGGTGDPADSGVGGTGIVGTITGFASVCIGALEVHYEPATPVSMNGEGSSLNQLAIGQVVAIEAGTGAKGLTARSISILNALEGPVTQAESRGVLEVMGQKVLLAAGIDTSPIAVGESVKVSGLRDARGVVHATRVEPAGNLHQASAIGFVRNKGGVASLDGLGIVGARGAAGTELLVRGTWDGKHLQVRERHVDPSLPFAGRVRDVVIEGLVHGRSGQRLQISGFVVVLPAAAARKNADPDAGIAEGSRVRVIGRIESGRRINAERIETERGRGGEDSRGSGKRPDSNSGGSDDDRRSSGGSSRDEADGGRGDDSSGSGERSSSGSDEREQRIGRAQQRIGRTQQRVGRAQQRIGRAQQRIGRAQQRVGRASKSLGVSGKS